MYKMTERSVLCSSLVTICNKTLFENLVHMNFKKPGSLGVPNTHIVTHRLLL